MLKLQAELEGGPDVLELLLVRRREVEDKLRVVHAIKDAHELAAGGVPVADDLKGSGVGRAVILPLSADSRDFRTQHVLKEDVGVLSVRRVHRDEQAVDAIAEAFLRPDNLEIRVRVQREGDERGEGIRRADIAGDDVVVQVLVLKNVDVLLERFQLGRRFSENRLCMALPDCCR